jgi:hypothetical protein
MCVRHAHVHSEKTPQELLQLLSDVLAKISPRALQVCPLQRGG